MNVSIKKVRSTHLIWPLPGVGPHVPLELAQLHRTVVALRALVGLLPGFKEKA